MEATLKQIIKEPSPNHKRDYFAVSLECPICHNDNTHIFYNINNKQYGSTIKCLHHNCNNKYIIPLLQIQDIDKQYTNNNCYKYHLLINNNIHHTNNI